MQSASVYLDFFSKSWGKNREYAETVHCTLYTSISIYYSFSAAHPIHNSSARANTHTLQSKLHLIFRCALFGCCCCYLVNFIAIYRISHVPFCITFKSFKLLNGNALDVPRLFCCCYTIHLTTAHQNTHTIRLKCLPLLLLDIVSFY